jgi:hypothetical protein
MPQHVASRRVIPVPVLSTAASCRRCCRRGSTPALRLLLLLVF